MRLQARSRENCYVRSRFVGPSVGQRIALRGGNPYRARAYGRAAENLLALTTPLSVLSPRIAFATFRA
jgi:hypothetical protein